MPTARTKQTANAEVDSISAEAPVQKAPIKKQREQIDPHTLVEVKNNTAGKVVYVSPRMMGYKICWHDFGDTELMEYSELMTMRNSARRFFEDNLIWIEDEEVRDALGVSKYYKDAVSTSNLDDLFKMSADTIRQKIALMSESNKNAVAQRAQSLIDSGVLDSVKKIRAVEESLDVKLV